MKHLKKVHYVIFASVILSISALNVTVFLKKAASANFTSDSIEAIAQETTSGESGAVDYSKGYINNPQDCKITEIRHCHIGATIPAFVPKIGGMKCSIDFDYTIKKDGKENFCTYTGGPSGCSYFTCKENGK